MKIISFCLLYIPHACGQPGHIFSRPVFPLFRACFFPCNSSGRFLRNSSASLSGGGLFSPSFLSLPLGYRISLPTKRHNKQGICKVKDEKTPKRLAPDG